MEHPNLEKTCYNESLSLQHDCSCGKLFPNHCIICQEEVTFHASVAYSQNKTYKPLPQKSKQLSDVFVINSISGLKQC